MTDLDNQKPVLQSVPIGIVGTGVMGASLARNFARNLKKPIAVFDLDQAKVDALCARHPEANLKGFSDLKAFVDSLAHPQVVLLMVPAGKPVDASLSALCSLIEPGSIVIDGGNTHFTDTNRRVEHAAKHGIKFIGMGVSGGHAGRRSKCMGGDQPAS